MKDTTFSLKVKRAIASKIGNKLFQWMFVDLTIKETGCNFEVIVNHEKSYSFCVSSLDDDNVRIEDRGVMSTKVYNSIPQKNGFGETHHKDQLPNAPLADRINPELLNAFRKNPYTQSLHSYAFN